VEVGAMADGNKLAEVVAMIVDRDADFKPLQEASTPHGDEPVWPLSRLKDCLGYAATEKIDPAVNRAKISAEKAGLPVKEHFVSGELFDAPGEVFMTKYACLLVTINADPSKVKVAIAQSYFALQTDKQRLEDEKRLRTRFDVTNENRILNGVAQDRGVQDFEKFNGVGLAALYGGRNQATVKSMKGLPPKAVLLDHAGSEELAANIFRITQTAAALKRQLGKSETAATETHRRVGASVRSVIMEAGNTPPELLPIAPTKIDQLATRVKKQLKASKR
jgi:DNA-damage-inducible protein D